MTFFLSQRGYLELRIKLPKYLFSRPMRFMQLLPKSLNFIGLPGRQKKRVNFEKKHDKKNLLHRNHKVDKANIFHTCLRYYPLHKS